VLEGSVQKAGNTIRVTAQLIKAADGFQLWSNSYDRQLGDIFAVQDEICGKAVKALQATLLGGALTASSKSRNPEAYNLVLQGRHFLADRSQETVARAVDYFRQALARDSSTAAAWSGLARAYTVQAGQGWIPVAEGYARSREAALKAIALDPQLADAYMALGYIQNTADWDWAAADSSYRKALALEPGNAETLRTAALLSAKLGRFDEAIRGLQQAIERDPLLAGAYSALAFMLDATGRSAEAETAARKALELGPTGILRHFNLARALVFQGKAEAAAQEIELEKGESWRLMGRAIVYHALHRKADSDRALAEYTEKNASHAAMQIADVHAYRGETNEAFTWLERAYDQHDSGIADIKDDPWLENIRSDARYRLLLRKVRLPE
jgi:tetratricopeptide (TPR) repeat protein